MDLPANDFREWFEGSAFVDDNGQPIIWCHGTEAEPFNIFAMVEDGSMGFHFGSRGAALERLDGTDAGEDARVVEVFCRARKPLRLRDHFTWTMCSVVGELEDLGVLKGDEGDAIYEACDDAMLFAVLERAGYDCIIYENETERHGDSLLIWRPELIKAVDAGGFDREDPRIWPQRETDEGDWILHRNRVADLERAHQELEALPRTLEMFT